MASVQKVVAVFKRALTPPEHTDPPRWAEAHRFLSRRQTSRPGMWRNSESPYNIGIMLMCVRIGVDVLTILKGAQLGVSEAIRCVIGYFAHLRPDPLLLVLPDKETGRTIVADRIIPLFEDTPVLRQLLPEAAHDVTKSEIVLRNGFTLRLGWSGSATSLASHPARVVINDERSKFQDGGKEADPESLGEERTATYADSKVINLSTPREDPDPTAQGFEDSTVKLYYFVPCPHCGTNQRLVWDRIKWEPKRDAEPDPNNRAALVIENGSAWAVCIKCEEKITDAHRRKIVAAGYWGTEDGGWKLLNDGSEIGKWPGGRRVGMQISALYSLAAKHTFANLAAQFIRAGEDPKNLQAFYNSKLGEVFRHQVASAKQSALSLKCRPDPAGGFTPVRAGIIAPWASRLLMTVDTQKDHFYVVVRAWGNRLRSHRVLHRKLASFEDLRHLFYNAWFHYQDEMYPPQKCHMLAIDSGGGKMGLDSSRTEAVYRFCLTDPVFLRPLKGDAALERSGQPWDLGNINIDGRQLKMLFRVNSQYFNDLLASAMDANVVTVDPETGEARDEAFWMLNDQDDAVYNAHLANMHKTRRRRGRSHSDVWEPKTAGARVDYRACEVYQFALAHGPANCAMLPTAQEMAAQAEALRKGAGENRSDPLGFNPTSYRGKW